MPIKIALVLQPTLNFFQFSVPYTIFSEVLAGQDLFEFTLVAEQPSVQSRRLQVQAEQDLSYLTQADIVMIAGWTDLTQPPSPALAEALHHAYQRGAYLVSLCYGTYAFAYAGLLDGKQATTHWLAETDFRQRFPQVRLNANALYIEDERIITSAGTSASLDCCLYLIRKFYGVKTANNVARIMVTAPHREGDQAQFIQQPIIPTTRQQKWQDLLQWLQQHLAEPHNIDDLANRLHLSRRTFTRHFHKLTGTSFTQWLIQQRLQKSLELLESGTLSIEQISEQIGFNNAVSFRQHFKKQYHLSPNEWRKAFRGNE
ncbi:GlxA family transcriptional regulator [Neisseria lisongii]|uniref:Helix-turn-helix domain-containing protein n=1 Tax=Neisseria lisongii TaxID=2912188 RepID=A0AAW5AEM2_9NEIS|nr:helix-turn-helix domain-containing protein [Neisseria lisongii]MCF7528642.1 helix-turn-helix domain-containing protein [Neisseria lisongii]MCF7529500.1 helix-turn-helix domain-containing protein [Neisseria lisongii]